MKLRKAICHGYLLISPLLIGCLLFYAIPFILVIQYSLSTGWLRGTAPSRRRW